MRGGSREPASGDMLLRTYSSYPRTSVKVFEAKIRIKGRLFFRRWEKTSDSEGGTVAQVKTGWCDWTYALIAIHH
jgi:hypothetical protein